MPNDELRKQAKLLPKRPGVYRYLDEGQTVLYVGKALSLFDRISSYFQKDIPAKTAEMLLQAKSIEYTETGSEFEALILEAQLIKKFRPKYNVVFRDDKSYLYVFISLGEEFPKIFLTRKPKETPKLRKYELFEGLKGWYFGPFPSAHNTRSLLRWLRRIIPFCQQKNLGKRPCFYAHIGLCAPCPGFIVKQSEPKRSQLKRQYRKNLLRLKRLLEGNLVSVEKDLRMEMHTLARAQKFEAAQALKERLRQLEWTVTFHGRSSVFLENPNYYFDSQHKAVTELVSTLSAHGVLITQAQRIECFDISTFQGNFSVASQVVFVDGIPEKSEYRRYRIRSDGKPNDFAMLAEAVTRRLNHPEWPLPDLLVIDGGKGQVSTIQKIIVEKKLPIPVIGLAKQFEKIITLENSVFGEVNISRTSSALQLVQALRDEAHRFSLNYHRKRRSKAFLDQKK